jgi:hypothetical protein
MYAIIIYFTMIQQPNAIMQAKSEPYPTIEECVRESKRLLTYRDNNVIMDGMKIKDAFCVKEK